MAEVALCYTGDLFDQSRSKYKLAYYVKMAKELERGRTGEGATISVSMFDAMAEWMTVPLLQYEGGSPPKRVGLAHPSIAPYGVFKTRDGADILISIQNDREWRVLAEKVMGDKTLAQAVRMVDKRVLTEASGGITLQTAPAIAASGVDLISIGWLTHSAPSLNLSLEFAVKL